MTSAGPPRRGALRRFLSGAGTLFRGFRLWGVRPGTMWLALLPALLVFVALAAAIVALGAAAPGIAAGLTPFADDWTDPWRELVRAAVGLALVLGAVWLAVTAFTGLTLAVGDPFYERVWRATEQHEGGPVPDDPPGFWRAAGSALLLVLAGLGVAVLVALLGLIPVVGTVVGTVVGVVLSGRLLAAELVTRPLEARGLTGAARRAALRGRGAELLGFGVATQLCFLVPLGAVVVMPAAVSGATLLAREAVAGAGQGRLRG
jgi:CysZ protein